MHLAAFRVPLSLYFLSAMRSTFDGSYMPAVATVVEGRMGHGSASILAHKVDDLHCSQPIRPNTVGGWDSIKHRRNTPQSRSLVARRPSGYDRAPRKDQSWC